MKKEIICGIYCIENKINNNKYIGQAIDIYKRWHEHISDLKCGNHYNNHLQNAWNKYKEENFIFYIIEECNQIDLNDKEVY